MLQLGLALICQRQTIDSDRLAARPTNRLSVATVVACVVIDRNTLLAAVFVWYNRAILVTLVTLGNGFVLAVTGTSRITGFTDTTGRDKDLFAVTALIAGQATATSGNLTTGGRVGRAKDAAARGFWIPTEAVDRAARTIATGTLTLRAVAVHTAAALFQRATSNRAAII